MSTDCALCGLDLPKNPVIEDPHLFCCVGCRAVFQILQTKGELQDIANHPIFKQAVHTGLISNPVLLEEIRIKNQNLNVDERHHLYLEVEDMWCPSCAEVIKLCLSHKKGVLNCVVDYATDIAAVEFVPRYLGKEDLLETIRKLGYQARELRDEDKRKTQGPLFFRLAVAAFCALNIMMFSYPVYASYFFPDREGLVRILVWLSFGFSLPVVTYCAWPIWRRFATSLQYGFFGMETLVALGVSSAFTLSLYNLIHHSHHVYFDSLTVIIAFVLVGKWIETKAKFSAKNSLFRLSRMLPRRARKRDADGQESFVPIKEIQLGDILTARTGEKIVLDGVIAEGEAAVDDSAMTGESVPTLKKAGDQVLAGSLLRGGTIAYGVTTTAETSVLQRVVNTVKHDLGRKSQYVRAADMVVRWFVPVIVLLAIVAAVIVGFRSSVDQGILRAMSILLISCPCALGIAAPLVEALLINRLADIGVLVRNRGALRWLGKDTAFFFDKTGTVTEGKFEVLTGLDTLDSSQKGILALMVSHSVHPISLAIRQALAEFPSSHGAVEELVGLGLRFSQEPHTWLLGSDKLLRQYGLTPPAASLPTSHVFFACDREILACIHLGDRMKDGVPEVIRNLIDTDAILLSGDGREVVESLQKQGGFGKAYWGRNPLEKREIIQQYRNGGRIVAMIGDGVNDAPALTAAHLGISVVSATDVSIQVSDFLLTTDKMGTLAKMRELGRVGSRVIKQNLFWAFFYNGVGVGLATFGYLSPLFSAFAMVASSVMVTLNAVRVSNPK